MGKKICSDRKVIGRKSHGLKPAWVCRKCGEQVVKEKWACKPKRLM